LALSSSNGMPILPGANLEQPCGDNPILDLSTGYGVSLVLMLEPTPEIQIRKSIAHPWHGICPVEAKVQIVAEVQ